MSDGKRQMSNVKGGQEAACWLSEPLIPTDFTDYADLKDLYNQ